MELHQRLDVSQCPPSTGKACTTCDELGSSYQKPLAIKGR